MLKDSVMKLVESFTQDIWNGANFDVANTLFADNFIDHDPILGQGLGGTGFVKMVQMLRATTPNLLVTNDAVYIDPIQNVVTIRWRAKGKSRGSIFDFLFGEKFFEHKGIDIFRIENDKFVEHWGEIDLFPL